VTHNIDFNVFHKLLISKTYKRLGNIPLYGDDMFADMTDVMDFVNSSKKKHIHNHMAMFEMHRIQDKSKCPIMIKEIVKSLKQYEPYKSRSMDVAGLVGLEGAVGYNWHRDIYHLVAMNIIGNTTWHFRDGNTVDMKPGDLMFVPSPIEHSVVGTTERFTLSFCCPINKGLHSN
jgi:mannose-6-phosphate isomerase-like protein (cupin superfamily)